MSDVDPSLEGPPWEEDAPEVEERDPNTDDMFGAPPAAPDPEPVVAPEPVEKPAATAKADTLANCTGRILPIIVPLPE